jgi:hypothetical protein
VPMLRAPAYSSRSTLSLCGQPLFRYFAILTSALLPSLTQDLRLFSPSLYKTGTMASADFSRQALLRLRILLLTSVRSPRVTTITFVSYSRLIYRVGFG